MRHEAIVLLAAVTSIVFLTARVARAKPDWSPPPQSVPSLLQRREPETGRGRTSIKSPRMITWSVCSAPSSGSALSIYSSVKKADKFRQGVATREDVVIDQCVDDE
jgi:hypothetical protein